MADRPDPFDLNDFFRDTAAAGQRARTLVSQIHERMQRSADQISDQADRLRHRLGTPLPNQRSGNLAHLIPGALPPLHGLVGHQIAELLADQIDTTRGNAEIVDAVMRQAEAAMLAQLAAVEPQPDEDEWDGDEPIDVEVVEVHRETG